MKSAEAVKVAGEVAKVAGMVSTSATTMFLITTTFLHRDETHGAIQLKEPARTAARAGTWILSGMKPREWVGVHLKHHEFYDAPGDPHSPVQNGRFGVAKVLFGNVPMYRKAAKQLQPGDYPEHLNPDALDRLLFDRGMLGQVVLGGIFTAIHKGDVKKGLITLGVHDATVIFGGGVINAWAHHGVRSIIHSLFHKPEPNEGGVYARNLNMFLTEATVGEGSHLNHHENPGNWQFNENILLDPGAVLIKGLFKLGLAEPGQIPTEEVAAAL